MKNRPSNRESRERRARSQVCWFKSIYKEYRRHAEHWLAIFGHGRSPLAARLFARPPQSRYVHNRAMRAHNRAMRALTIARPNGAVTVRERMPEARLPLRPINCSSSERIPDMATRPVAIGYCEERHRLLDNFAEAVTALVVLHERQVLALVEGKENLGGFDVMIHQASERKQYARNAYQSHLDTHGCGAMATREGIADPSPQTTHDS
jgi:hypothetical protein